MAGWLIAYPLWQRYGLTRERADVILRQGLSSEHLLLTAEQDGEPAGLAYVLPRGAFALSPYLRWLAVRPGGTRGGVGSALLQAAEVAAGQHRGDMFLLAADFNTDAHRFYERHQYVRVGVLPDYVVSGVSEYIYWKRLHE